MTAAEILSVAAFVEGKHAQAFPSFGPERSGAPVLAFCRIDTKPIRTHEPVVEPDAVVVQDPTLLEAASVLAGLAKDGFVLVNSPVHALAVAPSLPVGHVRTISASDIAVANLGRPLPNAALLGALVALTGAVGLAALVEAIGQRFSGMARDGNVRAARAAFHAIEEGSA